MGCVVAGLGMNDCFCPICKKKIPAEEVELSGVFPFCSERCKLVDLGQWLDGRYVVPGEDQGLDGGDEREN